MAVSFSYPVVPERFVGLWRRVSLESPAVTDTASEVYWLQGRSLFVDIRVPRPRPGFAAVTSLAEYRPSRLMWLASQQGFAGCLEVQRDLCRWHRALDFQPRPLQDEGRVAFVGDELVEQGVHEHYTERWQRCDTAGSETLALQLLGETRSDGRCAPRRGFLVVVGDWFMYTRDRRRPLSPAASLVDLMADADDSRAMAALVDCEISLGRRSGGGQPWEVQLSTLPYREGHSLTEFMALPQRMNPERCHQRGGEPGASLHWAIIDWHGAFAELGG